jgi:hypothetical protein
VHSVVLCIAVVEALTAHRCGSFDTHVWFHGMWICREVCMMGGGQTGMPRRRWGLRGSLDAASSSGLSAAPTCPASVPTSLIAVHCCHTETWVATGPV